jgi:hypothetical protein
MKAGKFLLKYMTAFVALCAMAFVVAVYGTPSQAALLAAEQDAMRNQHWTLVIVSGRATSDNSMATVPGFSTGKQCAAQVPVVMARPRTADAYCVLVQ